MQNNLTKRLALRKLAIRVTLISMALAAIFKAVLAHHLLAGHPALIMLGFFNVAAIVIFLYGYFLVSLFTSGLLTFRLPSFWEDTKQHREFRFKSGFTAAPPTDRYTANARYSGYPNWTAWSMSRYDWEK